MTVEEIADGDEDGVATDALDELLEAEYLAVIDGVLVPVEPYAGDAP